MTNWASDQQIIKTGLTQFIGTYLSQSPLKPQQARHDVAAALTEEIVKLSTDSKEQLDPYILKPMFKVLYNYFYQCYQELENATKAFQETDYDPQMLKIIFNKKNTCLHLLDYLKNTIEQTKAESIKN